MGKASSTRRRRDEALAFIIDRLVRTGASPTYEEIGDGIGVGKTRARQLVEQLVAAGIVEKVPGAQRALRVRDVVLGRSIALQIMRREGWITAEPLGPLLQTCPQVQLPTLSPFRHIPDGSDRGLP